MKNLIPTLRQSYLSENYARPRDGRPFWSSLPFEEIQSQSDEPAVVDVKEPRITLLESPKRIVFVIIFLFLTLVGVREIRINPRVGCFAVALFGTMCVISMVSLFRLSRDLKSRVGVSEAFSFKGASMWIVTIAVSFFLGFAGEYIVDVMDGPWPNFVIWLSCFVTTALFYPFRGEMKKDAPTFTAWAIYSAFCGFVSIAVAQLVWWLEQ